ncbi:MAG: Hsp20/alpha crystallin family protein [Nitrospinota bacterium]
MIRRDESVNKIYYTYMEIYPEKNVLGETSFIMIDVYETSEYFFVEAELPGVTADDIKIYTTGDNVVIEGTKREQIEYSGRVNFLCMERSFGPFRRIVNISSAVDKKRIKAIYSRGVLVIQIPKSKEEREKLRIEIERGDD